MKRVERLTGILTTLQSKQIVTGTELSKKYGISVRTIYRDIRSLEESGVPIVIEDGKGYSLVPGYSVPPIMFSQEEANALVTAEHIILKNSDASLSEHYKNAVLKIKAVLRGNLKDGVDLLSSRLKFYQGVNSSSSNILAGIQTALTQHKTLMIEYKAGDNSSLTKRIVEPLAIYSTKGNWILIGFCRLRQNEREFRLDRISHLEEGVTFTPRKFDINTYIENISRSS
jgi:predicted DNA-binding transcriptional regulator YafY